MILIDPPTWPAHGRLWSHLASDVSLAELHEFAAVVGIPPRAFETDHYDVPADRYHELVRAGARPVAGRDLLAGLVRAGIRCPRRKGEQVIASRHVADYLPGAGQCRVDVLSSPLPVPSTGALRGWQVDVEQAMVRLVEDEHGWRLPAGTVGQGGEPVGCVRVRLLGEPAPDYRGPRPWIFRSAVRSVTGPGHWTHVLGTDPHPLDHDIWPLVRLLAGLT